MLLGIGLLALVLVIATLIGVDISRTPHESPHVQTDRPAYGAERATTVPSRGPVAGALSPEPAGSATTVPPPDASLSHRPETISSPSFGDGHPGAWSAAQRGGFRVRLAGSDGRSRILLLAIIPAVTAAVVTLCVVRIVALLNGPSIHSQISSVHDGAVVSVLVTTAVLIVVLALGLWATIKAAGSVLRRWQRLRVGVLQAAGLRLPDTGRPIGENNGRRSAVGPVDVVSADEFGEAASVFDQMRREMARLTANEAALRSKLNALFANLGHRSRSLVERQIRLIEDLEHEEQDQRRLANLQRVNRIAFHVHRNSENLLILADHEPSAGSNQPVTLDYLIKAAAAEIEEGERVSSNVQPDIAVRGSAVGDVVHLLAELAQNATSFSSADMPVHITGQTLTTGGVLVDITDRGIGMTAKEMAYANWQLENPPATDIDASKWMGLLVVARLAARHGIRVRLNHAESGGLTAHVWLPDEVITYPNAGTPPMNSALGSAGSASGLPQAVVDPGYATAERTTTAAGTAEFASAQGNLQDAPTGPRLAANAGQRPGPAWSPGRPPSVSRAEPSVAAQAEPPVTAHAEQLEILQAEQLITPLQTEQPATLIPSGSAHPDVAGGNADVSGLAARPLGDETAPVEVIVPPAEDLARVSGPPIYDEVESHWFRSGRQAPSSSGRTAAAENRWSSPADEGWQAAQTVGSPSSAGSTAAGLPRRLPNANLLPGSIGSEPSAAPPRSAAAARDRLAGLQRGVSEGRAAAIETADPGVNDDS
jgi:signal transduction histidine kinase